MSNMKDHDLEEVEHILSRDITAKFLRSRKDQSFCVGDILLKKINNSFGDDPAWKYETVRGKVNPMYKRYMYVYEDPETKIGFIKQVKTSDGGLGSQLIPMTNFDPEFVRFEVDPLYIETLLLGNGVFDIKHISRLEYDRKKDIVDFNKSICYKSSTLSEVNNFFSTIKIGSTFYFSTNNGFTGVDVQSAKLLSIKKKYVSHLTNAQKYDNTHLINDKSVCDVKNVYILEIEFPNFSHKITYTSFEFIDDELYNCEPKDILSNGDR